MVYGFDIFFIKIISLSLIFMKSCQLNCDIRNKLLIVIMLQRNGHYPELRSLNFNYTRPCWPFLFHTGDIQEAIRNINPDLHYNTVKILIRIGCRLNKTKNQFLKLQFRSRTVLIGFVICDK